ncbi:3'-5' exonuclease [Pseudomonas sp. MBLB4123]|uniref:3'-5' exonuclease n=1 Tax=Pseudomonas sp. MBLB4123 TaxID=3451557 RepID=UPI003F74CFA7
MSLPESLRKTSHGVIPDWPKILGDLAESTRDERLARFYRAGTVSADTPLEQVPLLALDVETTGLDSQRDSIVSLGLVPFNLQRIRCGAAKYWVVKPVCELSSQSVTFHHITHSDIRDAPPLANVLDELLAAMAGKVVVVHYRRIERGFLDQAMRQLVGEGLHFPLIDTMQLEARLHLGKHRPGWLDRLLGKKPVSIRLADSRLRYGLPLYQAHHALTDALATAELLQAQVASLDAAQIAVGELWQ